MITLTIDSWIGEGAYDAQWLRRSLDEANGEDIELRISSFGGDASQAIQMYEMLKEYGNADALVYGHTASAATIIAMGCRTIKICKTSMFLIHKCLRFIDIYQASNSNDLEDIISNLEANKREQDKIDLSVAGIYADKSGKSPEELMTLLGKDEWMTPEEALDCGLVDEIVDSLKGLNLQAQMQARLIACGLPPLPEDALKIENDRESYLNRLASFLKKIRPSRTTEEDTSELESTVLAEILGKCLRVSPKDAVEGITSEDVEKIETRINDLKAEIASLKKDCKEYLSQIESLKEMPGDDTKKVFESDEGSGEEKTKLFYNKIKHLI